MSFWQIACGDGTVDLNEIFLKLNVALIGPGSNGDYFDHRDQYEALSDGKLIKRFAEEIQLNDILVLKRVVNPHKHTWEILAVGEVVGPYRYEPIFEAVDEDKWDMQHCRRVYWRKPRNQTIVNGGGAPVRIQRMEDTNPLVVKAKEILKENE